MSGNADGPADPQAIVDREEFGRALTWLRDRAGLSIRDVARQVGASHATLGDYFAGKSLPQPAQYHLVPRILAVLGVTDPDQLQWWQEAVIRIRRSPARRHSTAPYRGLEPFQPEDADWFYGRDRLVKLVLEQLLIRRDQPGPLFVIGPSGSGKSSLVAAGVVPALRAGGPGPQPAGWRCDLLTPGEDLGATLAACTGAPEPVAAGDRPPRVVIVDQFEQVFAASVAEDDRATFVAELTRLARSAPAATLIVVGMRADFYARAVGYPALAEAIQASHVVVGPMSEDEVRSAIVEPARRAGVRVEDGLVELLLRDFAPDPTTGPGARRGTLPLLSHALLATWQRGGGRELTVEDYLASGSVAGAVAKTAEAVYAGLTRAQQRVAERLFLRLVHVDDETIDTKRCVPRSALDIAGTADVTVVLDRFVEQRLLTADIDTVEITHEALLQAWPRLKRWLDADRVGARVHRRLIADARFWYESDRDPSNLYRGSVLAAAREWAADTDHAARLSPAEAEFLSAGVAEQQAQVRQEDRRIRRLRRLVSVLGVLVLLAGGLTFTVFQQRTRALHDRDLAVSRQVATEAATLRASDPALADQLAVAAYQIAPTAEARSSLIEATVGPAVTRVRGSTGTMATALTAKGDVMAIGDHDGRVRLWRIDTRNGPRPLGPPFRAISGSVFATAFSPDGRTLAVGGKGETLRRWDVTHPDTPVGLPDLPGQSGVVNSIAFSPDGQALAAGTNDHGVQLWRLDRAASPDPPVELPDNPTTAVNTVAFSPDGRLLAAGGLDRAVRLWSVSDGRHPVLAGPPITGPAGTVYSVAFSPDGRTLGEADADRSVYLWDVGQPAQPRAEGERLTGFAGWVNAVAFSSDGRILAAGSTDNTARVWQLSSRRLLATLPHPGPVTGAAFDPRGRLVTSAADGYARLWALPANTITDPPDAVFTVAFKSHADALAVNSESSGAVDGSVEWWKAGSSHEPPQPGPTIHRPTGGPRFSGACAVSPDGNLLAVGNLDGSTQLWDVHNLDHPVPVGPLLTGPKAQLETLAFSPASDLLAVGGDDHTAWVWDVTTPRVPRLVATLTRPTGTVFGVAFSAHSRLLAVASSDHNTYLWDMTDPAHPHPLPTLAGPVNYAFSVAFSPDGRTAAVGSADKTVTLWDLTDVYHPRQRGEPLTGPTNYVYGVAFSPDGVTLAAGSTDASVWLWNVADPDTPEVDATLHASAAVYSVAFSSDSQTLAAGTADMTARLWRLDPGEASAFVCAGGGDPITPAEWRQYVPNRRYTIPCR